MVSEMYFICVLEKYFIKWLVAICLAECNLKLISHLGRNLEDVNVMLPQWANIYVKSVGGFMNLISHNLINLHQ